MFQASLAHCPPAQITMGQRCHFAGELEEILGHEFKLYLRNNMEHQHKMTLKRTRRNSKCYQKRIPGEFSKDSALSYANAVPKFQMTSLLSYTPAFKCSRSRNNFKQMQLHKQFSIQTQPSKTIHMYGWLTQLFPIFFFNLIFKQGTFMTVYNKAVYQ